MQKNLLMAVFLSALSLMAGHVVAGSVACTPDAGYTGCMRFTYSGSDQDFTVPANTHQMNIKAWGAGGGGSSALAFSHWRSIGGAGGYVSGTLTVTPGDQFKVVVGQGGFSDNASRTGTVYGFGGSSKAITWGSDGGGLSGLFSGTGSVSATDSARALLVAGGGGAGELNASPFKMSRGGQGGDSYSGGLPSMAGGNSTSRYGGAGGGGYAGGAADVTRLSNLYTNGALSDLVSMGEGGSNYVASNVTGGVNLFATYSQGVTDTDFQRDSSVPPNTSDAHYSTGIGLGTIDSAAAGGNGEVIIQWNVAGTRSGVTTVPTLQFWSLLLLASVMAGLGMAARRKRVF